MLLLEKPTAGRILLDGQDLTKLSSAGLRKMRTKMQIIFQDPYGSLNPRMPVSDIIGEGLLAQGVHNKKERIKRVEDALDTVGLRRDYTRRYPHEFSGGQRQRIGIARALVLNPEFIVCDEAVSALDVSIQSQILNLLLDLRREMGLTYLFVAHNLSVVQYVSDRVGVMYLGQMAELAGVDEIYAHPRHPYTIALLSAVPNPDPRVRKKRIFLEGDVPSPANPPSGCRFHTRCWLRKRLDNPENCVTEEPQFREIGVGHQVACHLRRADRRRDGRRARSTRRTGRQGGAQRSRRPRAAPGTEPAAGRPSIGDRRGSNRLSIIRGSIGPPPDGRDRATVRGGPDVDRGGESI